MDHESNFFCFHVWLILLGKRLRPGTKYRDHKEAIEYAKQFHVMLAGLARMTVGSIDLASYIGRPVDESDAETRVAHSLSSSSPLLNFALFPIDN